MRIDTAGTIWQVDYFRNVARGAAFWCNGNKWRKQSSRTARPISDGIPNRAFYFRGNEICESVLAR